MLSHIRGLRAAVVCTVALFGSPGSAAADPPTTAGHDFYAAAVLSDGPIAISVSPTSGPPGTTITVGGTNWTHETFASGIPINIYQNYGNGNLKRLAEGSSGPPDSEGNFSVQMTVPSSAEPGLVTVSTLTGGGYSPSAQFTVTGASSESPTPGQGANDEPAQPPPPVPVPVPTPAGAPPSPECIPTKSCIPREDGAGAWWADSVSKGTCAGQSDEDWLVFYKTDNSYWRRANVDDIRFGAASWSKVSWPLYGALKAQANDISPPGITLCFGAGRYDESDVKGTYVRLC